MIAYSNWSPSGYFSNACFCKIAKIRWNLFTGMSIAVAREIIIVEDIRRPQLWMQYSRTFPMTGTVTI